MPTVIISPPVGAPLGPGREVQVVTTTVGPFSSPSWEFQFIPDDIHDGETITWGQGVSDPHVPLTIKVPVLYSLGAQHAHMRSGTTGHIRAALHSGATEVEFTTTAIVADFVEGPISIMAQGSDPISNSIKSDTASILTLSNEIVTTSNNVLAGITSSVSTLAGTVSATIGEWFSGKTLDQIVVVHVTSGPTCDPFEHTFGPPDVLYGLIVTCTSVPPWYAFTSPGTNWTPRNLATLTITRGENLLARYGVHTLEFTVYPLPGVITIPVSGGVPVTPPSYHVRVDWGEEVCGELLAMIVP
jgi:hypothetical protein